MAAVTLELLTELLELADHLRLGRDAMFEPQDLPGRYGRVVKAVDKVLSALQCEGLLAGGWAVWRHGYLGRVTQDLDVVVPAARVAEFLRVAVVSGFDVLSTSEGAWPKLQHRDTGTQVDLLPEGGRPGSLSYEAPTTIPHPGAMGALPGSLTYIPLRFLVELKIAAGRARDDSDIIELMRANPEEAAAMRQHLEGVHSRYVAVFDHLLERASDQRDS